jgi:lipooligosaccharide transport system permease protein
LTDLDTSATALRVGWPTWLRALWAHSFFYSRVWKGSITTSFLFPTLYLTAMGVGLGSLVDHHVHHVGGVRYIDFLAPGLLAGTLLQVATGESTFPVLGRIKWDRTYYAMLATPLSATDVVIGHLLWVAIRGAMVSSIFLFVMVLFGCVHSWLALLVIPLSCVAAFAFAAPTTAFAATTKSENAFPLFYRFGVIPLFLFSATFFPLEQLPRVLQVIAQFTPLVHVVLLMRNLTLGNFQVGQNLFDLAYLLVLCGLGWHLARRAFNRRLVV